MKKEKFEVEDNLSSEESCKYLEADIKDLSKKYLNFVRRGALVKG